ncbi:MAG: hypothetical protein JWO94_1765, partial [Verrucomicrobiaceae bacterium]|nr:hypothetical protein [Verrucomicrobiaceae bacterium]
MARIEPKASSKLATPTRRELPTS